jgi:hypothetical protein
MHANQSARMSIRDKSTGIHQSAVCDIARPEISTHLRASLLIRVHLRLKPCVSMPGSAAIFGTGMAADDLGKHDEPIVPGCRRAVADNPDWRRAMTDQDPGP